jgi:hypothetical protein
MRMFLNKILESIIARPFKTRCCKDEIDFVLKKIQNKILINDGITCLIPVGTILIGF